MKVKVIQTENYSKSFIVLREEGELYHFINEEGDLAQNKRDKLSIDSEVMVEAEEVYRVLGHHDYTFGQLEYLLKYLSLLEKEKIEKFFHLSLVPHNKSNICYEDLENHAKVLIYYSHFFHDIQKCEIEVYEHHLNFLKEGKKEIVLFVMEEFGTFYLNGSSFLNYLHKCTAKRKNGKKYWTINIDYEELVRCRGEYTFHDYSDTPSFLKKSTERDLEKHLHDNVVDINTIRDIQNMFKKIKDRKSGFRVVREGKKKEREA